ncbi:diacylglycerol kinase family protein [Bacillus cereus]
MKKGKLIDSFGYAIVGIFFCLRHERNMKIHYLAAVVVICCGFYFHITKVEWMVLLIVIGIVMSLEMVNTAVEKNSRFSDYRYTSVCESRKGCRSGSGFIVCDHSRYNWCYYLFTVCGIVAFQSFS